MNTLLDLVMFLGVFVVIFYIGFLIALALEWAGW
jgi:hypothetical protein